MRAAAASLLISLGFAGIAHAEEIVAFYRASWAGLPAGEIRLSLGQGAGDYRDRIAVEAKGLPRWITKFRGGAVGEGRFAADGSAAPSRYDALYDLRKRHGSHISMRFVERDGVVIAERGAEDTSRKPPLADLYRRNVVDPLSALAFIRRELQIHRPHSAGPFMVPAYDGARRFDVAVENLSGNDHDGLILLKLTLRPIAGFKGESSDDGDPEDAPRAVAVAFTDDAMLLPISLRVPIWYLPLIVRFDHLCPTFATCTDAAR